MNFLEIMQQLTNLKKSLQNVGNISEIEQDILKETLRGIYMTLCDKPKSLAESDSNKTLQPQAIPQAPVIETLKGEKSILDEIVIIKKIKENPVVENLSEQEIISQLESPATAPEKVTLPPSVDPPKTEISKKVVDLDYKSLADIFLDRKQLEKRPLQEDNSLASKMAQSKITDLKRAIAMHDRFIFIKELFNNDFDAYTRNINELNSYLNFTEAQQHVERLKKQYRWRHDHEVVIYFLSFIERRFS